VSVAGALKPSEWTDKATGEMKRGLNITVSAALSAYDVKKRRGNTGSAESRREPDYSEHPPYNDPVLF